MITKTKIKSEQFVENSFPKTKKVECFQCRGDVLVKYVLPRQEYSHKNDWSYWSGEEEKEKKYICDKDLLILYKNKPIY